VIKLKWTFELWQRLPVFQTRRIIDILHWEELESEIFT